MIFHLRTPPVGSPTAAEAFEDIPKDAAAKFENGREKLAKGNAKGSISDFEAAIATYPKFAAAYYEKGAAYLKLNDPDKATAAFVQAIEIKPDYLEAKYGYGLAQFQKKEYVVAAAAFNDVLQQKRDIVEAHLNLGISLYHLKNVEAAEAELKLAATNGGGKLPLAHLYLGQIYAQKKKNAEAANELQKYVDLAPNAPNVERIKLAIADLKKQS
jgi:tetratricopeptide (TPR) repeat protein